MEGLKFKGKEQLTASHPFQKKNLIKMKRMIRVEMVIVGLCFSLPGRKGL